MKSVMITYNLTPTLTFIFAEHGDLLQLFVNGADRSDDGGAVDAALIAIHEAGYDLSADISEAFAEKYAPTIFDDPDHFNDVQRDIEIERKSEGA